MRWLVVAAAQLAAAPLVAGAVVAEPLFLWHATRDAAEVWLLGSVHVGSDDFFPLDPRIEAAFAAADTVACEIDLTDPAKAARAALLSLERGTYPEGETLREHVNEETWRRLEAALDDAGVPLAMVERARPTMAAVLLAMGQMSGAGLAPDQGIDVHLLARARADGRPVVDLETVEQQVEALFGQDEGLEELILAESLAQTGDQVRELIDRMIAAWRAGDADAMDGLLREQWRDDPRLVAFHSAILGRRNLQMAAVVDRRAGGGAASWFVVVGAAHLVGDSGVPALLAGAGWRVAQVR